MMAKAHTPRTAMFFLGAILQKRGKREKLSKNAIFVLKGLRYIKYGILVLYQI